MYYLPPKLRTWFLIMSLLATVRSFGQSYSLKYIDVSHGLPSNETFCVFQKDVGELYIGTEYGLVLYDGEDFTQIPFENGRYSGATVFDVRTDRRNRTWIYTYRNGLFVLDDDTLRPFAGNPLIKKVMQETTVSQLQFDDDENVWFTLFSCRDTVFMIDKNGEKLSRINVNNHPDLQGASQILYEIDERAYLAVRSSVDSMYRKDWEVRTVGKSTGIFSATTDFNIAASRPGVFIDRNRDFFLSNGRVLLHCNKESKQVESYDTGSEIVHINEDQEGNVLVGARNGAFLLSTKEKKLKELFSHHLVTGTCHDNEKGYWFSTNKGLVYMPSMKIRLLSNTEPTRFNVISIDGSGNRMASLAYDGTIALYEPDSLGEITNVFKHIRQISTPPKRILFVNDQLVFGHGKLNPNNLQETRIMAKGWGEVLDIEKGERSGDILFSFKRGFALLEQDGTDKPLIRASELFSRSIHQAQDKIYVGTDHGLYCFEEGVLRPFFHDEISYQINDIQSNSSGTLFLATRGGLFVIENNQVHEIGFAEGLSSLFCSKIHVANDSTFWVGTNRGINRVTRGARITTVDSWSTEDGLISDKINGLAAAGDYLFVLTDLGINYLSSKQITVAHPLIKIQLREVKVRDEHRTYEDSLHIKPKQRDLSFAFKILGFKKRENLQLQYVLSGPNQVLSQTGGETIKYKDLEPGHYSLHVSAINANGQKIGLPLEYKLVLDPFFYETTTFWVSLLVLGLTLGALIIFFYLKQLEQQRRHKWEYANAQLEALNLQMNPHFIFNALGNVQSLIFSNNRALTNRFIVGLSALFRKVLINANTSLISLEDEITIIKQYIELEVIRIENERFDHEINIDHEIQLKNERIPPMLIQPLIENAIWHGLLPAEKTGLVLILNIHKIPNGFEIEVIDNGVGIDLNAKDRIAVSGKKPSLGLNNVKRRINLYESIGFGTARMHIENLKGVAPFSSGTKVVLHFEK